jgi:LPXTG-motif cell wall-anchored protein
MSLHYLNGILTQNETINKINKNAFKKGIEQMRKPEFKTPYTMNSYDVNDCLFYPVPTRKKKQNEVNGLFDNVANWVQTNITQPVQTAVTNVVQTGQTAAQNISQTINTGVQNVVTTTQQALQTIQSQGAAALTNVQNTIQQGLQNIPTPQQFKDDLNSLWSKVQGLVGKYGKKIALQPMRTAFLIVVSANAFRLGTNLANAWNKDKNKITNWWVNDWGGDINILKQAINRSSNITLNGNVAINGDPVTLTAVTAAIAEAAPVIASIAGILTSLGLAIKPLTDAIAKMKPKKEPTPVTATSPSVEKLGEPTGDLSQVDLLGSGTGTTDTNKTLMYVGIGGALLVGGYLLMKKKK